MKRIVPTLMTISALALGSLATAPSASAAAAPGQGKQGTTSLAEVLTSDGDQFDKNSNDFDILTEAALAVVAAKPGSPVALVADGKTRLTVFAPTDRAFRKLLQDLSGKKVRSEKKIFETLVDSAGVDTIESVLLYHVVPGATLTSDKVLKADGTKLETALGKTVKVRVKTPADRDPKVILRDKDRDDRDPHAILEQLDLNKGNRQVAHAIDRVLRPIDL